MDSQKSLPTSPAPTIIKLLTFLPFNLIKFSTRRSINFSVLIKIKDVVEKRMIK